MVDVSDHQVNISLCVFTFLICCSVLKHSDLPEGLGSGPLEQTADLLQLSVLFALTIYSYLALHCSSVSSVYLDLLSKNPLCLFLYGPEFVLYFVFYTFF